MKMCQHHWDMLRKAINERGLSSFVSKSGEVAVESLKENKFEPLLGAHNAITMNTLSTVGLSIMAPNEDGTETCPICFLMSCPCDDPECSKKYEGWINRAADDQVDIARELGLLQNN